MISLPIDLASGRTRFSSASPWKVKASLAPCSWQALAMPQAIERSLATPMTRPFFPAINCAGSGHASFLAGLGHWDKMPVVGGSRSPSYCGHDPGKGRSAGACSANGTRRPRRASPTTPTPWRWPRVGPDGMPSLRMVLLKGYDAAGLRLLHQLLRAARASSCWPIPRRRCCSTGSRCAARCGSRAGIADHAGGGRRLFRHPRARQPDRRLGVRPVAAAGEPLRAGEARRRIHRPASSSARCRARRTGRASACSRCLIEFWQDGAVPPARPAGVPPCLRRRALDDAHALSLRRRWRSEHPAPDAAGEPSPRWRWRSC